MIPEREELRCEGLRFFGTISASVTHELKNTLAIVRELSGLMGDLAAAVAPGGDLPADRVADLSARIATQVARADGIVRRMNAFSHSVDHPRAPVDVREAATGLAGLCRRFADMARVDLATEMPEDPVVVETDAFVLQHVLFLPLRRAIAGEGEGGRVMVGVEADDAGARMFVAGRRRPPEGEEAVILSLMLSLLGARAEEEEGRFVLLLPPRMPDPERGGE